MSEPDDDLPPSESDTGPAPGRRSHWKMALLLLLAVLFGLALYGWFTREQIADNLIAGQLEGLGIEARYDIVEIGPRQQVIRNIVVGDPEKPDLTIERVTVAIRPRVGVPGIGRITLDKPRLFGQWRDGRVSFGSLDPVIYTDSKEPFRLPDLDLAIRDGRALVESEYGAVAAKLHGAGPLRDGFAGELAALAPSMDIANCTAGQASLYGTVRVAAEKPMFKGPLRLASMACPQQELAVRKASLAVDLVFDKALDGAEGTLGLSLGPSTYGQSRLAEASGKGRFSYRGGALTARYELEGERLFAPAARAARIALDGHVRGADAFARLEIEGSVTSEGLAPGQAVEDALVSSARAGEGTLAEPLLLQLHQALRRESRASGLAGSFILRRTGKVLSLVVPRMALRGRSGDGLLTVSRFQLRAGGDTPPRLSGNFATGGKGLPKLNGRMEQGSEGRLMMRLRMPEYQAGTARIALPELLVAQSGHGTLGFAGKALVSGAMPGGHVEGLVLPLDGNWSNSQGLSLWRRCTQLRFDALELADLALDARSLSVCPRKGRAIVSYGPKGLAMAGGVPSLDLSGKLGETPIELASGPVGFAWPGVLKARTIAISLGPPETASQFALDQLDARLGSEVAGTFANADVRLDAVPLNIVEAAGNWKYEDGVLSLGEGSFRLEDREEDPRFQPLVARDAVLRLEDNVITAQALLREPLSGREVLSTAIRHELATGRGGADILLDGLVFDEQVQPDTLTRYALGVIANAKGVVRGRGRIDWNEIDVTSSGRFATEDFDFAAAFGPVEGVAGTVEFTDLLNVVTAPGQTLSIASINPGIEVNDGLLTFAIEPDYLVRIGGAKWPFLDGTLTLQPVTMQIGSDDPLHYTLGIDGIDAARFIEQMELGNLSASGTFDGTLPLVFDQDGGHIREGFLKSRPPGGNVSYVGELTYEDLSTMANFAFAALRSLDYREMTIAMNGDIDGEIVSRVEFSGISQGEGTSSNFLTRQIAKLPIRFNISLRAPFYQLITSFKGLYDTSYVRDPRSLGLMDSSGQPVPRPTPDPDAILPKIPTIQRPESEDMP